jgi:uncharacterized protein (DUF1697 family)
MAVYVLLLRAIGPATHSKMSMAALREGCEAAGFSDVTTVGNTGNVICRSTKSPLAVRKLAQEVVNGFGLGPSVEVFVRTPVQMAFVVETNPFPDAAQDRPAEVGVCCFHNSPRWPAAIRNHPGPQKLATVGANLIVDYPGGNASGFNVEKIVGARMTQRNWRVFANLAEKAAALAKSK